MESRTSGQAVKRHATYPTEEERQQLIGLLHAEACSCVIANGGTTRICRRAGREGPLPPVYRGTELLDGAFVADKVVGKGAAALMILGGVTGLHADVISPAGARAARHLPRARELYARSAPHRQPHADGAVSPWRRSAATAPTPPRRCR